MKMPSEYLCVFLKYKNMDMQNGHSKNESICTLKMASQKVLAERRGMQQRYVEKNTISPGTWLHARNNAKVYL